MRHAPPDFVAVDFETATTSPDSACAVGLVRVERGRIVRRFARRIRPPSRRFEFTHVHGLAWDDVRDAPSFAELWPEVAAMCEGVTFLAAHNAEFDRRVLRACCAAARVRAPQTPFRCTVEMARRAWGIYPTRLDVVSARLGIPLRHHDAASDAEACANIVLRAWA
jgi:DNA polymerase-3 subunit epsilon